MSKITDIVVQVKVPVTYDDNGSVAIRYADLTVTGSTVYDTAGAPANVVDSAERAVKNCLRYILGDV